MSILKNKKNGLILVEVVIAIALLVIIGSAVLSLSLGSFFGALRGEQHFASRMLAQESLEAVRAVKEADWNSLTPGDHGLTDQNGFFELTNLPDIKAPFTRTIAIQQINPVLKEITVTISWQALGVTNTLKSITRLALWKYRFWRETLVADFSQGLRNSTIITNQNSGELQLEPVSDWANTEVFVQFDFDGSGDVKDLFIENNRLYLIITNNDSNQEGFSVFDISNISGGILPKIGGISLSTDTYGLAVKNGYAYISTSNNTEEVTVIRLSDYKKVASINTPGSANGQGIFVIDTMLFVTTAKSGSAEFYTYDITNPEQINQAPVNTVELNASGNALWVNGNYAYIATSDDSREFIVVRLNDGTIVNTFDLPGNADATSLFGDGSKIYISTNSNSNGAEFYLLSLASPEGAISQIGSTEIGNDVSDFHIAGQEAFIATHAGGNEELAVIDLTTFLIKNRIDILGSPTAEAIILYGAYIYVGSSNNTETLQVIRNTPDNQVNPPFATIGTFTSQAHDTGSAATVYRTLYFTHQGGGSSRLQLRAGDTLLQLATAPWIGPDGTAATFYPSNTETPIVLPLVSGHQFIQYQLTLTGDATTSSRIDDVLITYE